MSNSIKIGKVSIKNVGDVPSVVAEYLDSLKKKEGETVEESSVLPEWKPDYTRRTLNQVFRIPGEESRLLSITDDGSSETGREWCSLEICKKRGERYRVLYEVASFDYKVI